MSPTVTVAAGLVLSLGGVPSTSFEVEAMALAVDFVVVGGVNIELDGLEDNNLSAAPGGGRAAVPSAPLNLVGSFDVFVDAEDVSAFLILSSDNWSVNLARSAIKAVRGEIRVWVASVIE
jgi:hypothetical protein